MQKSQRAEERSVEERLEVSWISIGWGIGARRGGTREDKVGTGN